MIKELNDLLQHAERKLIPISLTFALFRFDVGGLIRWSPILQWYTQREYEREMRSAKSRTKAKESTITERILQKWLMDEGDEEAASVIGKDPLAADKWRLILRETTIPLIRKYWDKLVPGIADKLEDWLRIITRVY